MLTSLDLSAALDRVVPFTLKAAAPAAVQIHPRIRGGLPPRAVRCVCDYVEAHPEENISLQVLAGVAGKSMHPFARAFRQSTGLTPHRYLLQSCLRRLQDLLARTDVALAEIALMAGFSDQSHCARRFRDHFGVTPSSYRWSMR